MVKKFSLSIKTLDNTLVRGDLYRSNPDNNVIIVCLGYKDRRNTPVNLDFVDQLSKGGKNVFTFDFVPETPEEDIRERVNQLNTVVEYFQAEGYTINLIGFSMGALISSIVSKNTKIKKLITINGFFGFPLLSNSMFKTYVGLLLSSIFNSFHRELFKYIISNLNFKSIKIPVVCIYSDHDEIVSPKQTKHFFKKISSVNKKLIPLKNITHGFYKMGEISVLVRVLLPLL